MRLIQLYVRMNQIQNNASHLISQQSCVENFVPRTTQHALNTIGCVQSEESNYVPIPTDQKIEDDDNDDNDDDEEEDDKYIVE
jgi:hypothetical protein